MEPGRASCLILSSLHEQLRKILIPSNSSLDILCIVYQIFQNSHFYLNEWESLTVESSLAHDVAAVMRRYEGSFQLRGLGIWLIEMLVTHLKSPECLDVLSAPPVIEDLFRISLEHPTQDKCIRIFYSLFSKQKVSFSLAYEIINRIADQLPIPLKYSNFMDLFKLVFSGARLEMDSLSKGLDVLTLLIPRVETNAKAQYFLSSVLPVVLSQLDPSLSFKQRMSCARFLSELAGLHHSHPVELLTMGVVDAVLALVMPFLDSPSSAESELSVKLLAALLDVLQSVCHDPAVRVELLNKLSPTQLASCLDKRSLEYVEAASGLFNVLFLQTNHAVSPSQPSGGQDSNFLCSFLVPLMNTVAKCLETNSVDCGAKTTDLVESRASADLFSSTRTDTLSVISRVLRRLSRFISVLDFPELRESVAAAKAHVMPLFDDMNSFDLDSLDVADLLISLSGVQSECWRSAPLLEDKQLLTHAEMVSHVGTYISRDPPPLSQIVPFEDDQPRSSSSSSLVLQDIINEEPDVITVTTTLSSSALLNKDDNPTLSSSPCLNMMTPRQRSRSADDVDGSVGAGGISPSGSSVATIQSQVTSRDFFRENAVRSVGQRLLDQNEGALKELTDGWALIPTPNLCQQLVYLYVISSTAGLAGLERVVVIPDVGEMILELLSDDRLGVIETAGMQLKCMQLLSSISSQCAVQVSVPSVNDGPPDIGIELLHKLPFATALADMAITNFTAPDNGDEFNVGVYLSLLMALCEQDRQCRRAVVKSFAKIHDTAMRLCRSSALLPLLRLTAKLTDCIGKIDVGNEMDGIEALLVLIVSSLRMQKSHGYEVCILACKCIVTIGEEHTGLAHRLFMRREVEDCLASLLYQGGVKSTAASRGQPSPFNEHILLVIKACIVCVRDVNASPWWQYSSISHHWLAYADGLIARPLLSSKALDWLVLLSTTSNIKYRLLVFTACLEYASALMYDCCDGNLCKPFAGQKPEKVVDYQAILKANLISKILPLLPKALAIIINRDNSKTVTVQKKAASPPTSTTSPSVPVADLPSVSSKSDSAVLVSSTSAVDPVSVSSVSAKAVLSGSGDTDHASEAPGGQKKLGIMTSMKNSLVGLSYLKPASLGSGGGASSSSASSSSTGAALIPPTASAKDQNKQRKRDIIMNVVNPTKFFDKRRRSQIVSVPSSQRGATGIRPSLYRSWSATSSTTVNRALEGLTEKTVDALFSFLCLDDMFPLSTYLMNLSKFERTPVCACLAYSMSCYPENLLIQKRGIEIFRCFAENKVELSSLGMHASTALMIALKKFDDMPKLQNSFAKIIAILAASDDFARDNLVRYSVQDGLASIVKKSTSSESVVLALTALSGLACSPGEAACVAEGSGVVSAVLAALESHSSDQKVQIEGLRVLIALSQTAEFEEALGQASAEAILKKSRRTLLTASKQQKIVSGYTQEDVDSILEDPQLAGLNDNCIIS